MKAMLLLSGASTTKCDVVPRPFRSTSAFTATSEMFRAMVSFRSNVTLAALTSTSG
jgi:hypothetical protein